MWVKMLQPWNISGFLFKLIVIFLVINCITGQYIDTSPRQRRHNGEEARWLEEARYNLATRVMSNGVEVIVAGDKSTLPGEPDVKRILPSSIYKPVTLKPSTLTDHMMMQLPQDSTDIGILPSSLYPNQFVTKTCLTTFTFLTTFVENGTTAVSSREQVISNIATEERNTGKILPTPAMGITLTQYPNLSVGIFPTTYTYFNTIMDGEQPLVVQSKHTVTNTVTAPDDYLSLLQPLEKASAVKDTNTYHSTVTLTKTLVENDETKVISTEEIFTQVVITESIPPKATSVMTSYIALDVEDADPSNEHEITTTDVIKTYFITYTYFNTISEDGGSYVQTNISTSTDVVTEKLYLHPKRTSMPSKVISTKPIIDSNQNMVANANFEILATKTYLTTFTSLTTMLSQKPDGDESTVVSSRFRVVENVMTETVEPSLLDKEYLNSIREEIKTTNSITKVATVNGNEMEVVFIAKDAIKPTSVLPIEKTEMPDLKKSDIIASPSIITGSTIVFVNEDDDPFKLAASEPTPIILTSKIAKTTTLTNNLNSLLSSEIVSKASKNTKRHTNKETISISKPLSTTSSKVNKEPSKNKPANKISRPSSQVSDLLGLGSLNINRLTPVLNVMADFLQNNLKKTKKNETITTTSKPFIHFQENIKPKIPAKPSLIIDTQNRSPVYIPVGGFTDIDVAESQNIATFHLKEQIPWGDPKLKHESPLLNGGIPISPGEIITANSDVIVGKPGLVGPRIPAIPLRDLNQDDPIDMKPPPLVQKNNFPKRGPEKKRIPIRHDKPSRPIFHAPNKDDYVGPPPPQKSTNNHDINDNLSHLSGAPNNYENLYNIPLITNQDFSQKESPQDHNYPHVPVILGTPVNAFHFQPSIINKQMGLPEVIERSTGQPLLVNIQPSQVAFVNIPHNRTTALIFGGSTEPHINGQYFDDPSPYPQPEFSGVESYNDGVAQIASIYNQYPYNDQNHKQVGGTIKVDARPIIVNPSGIQVSPGETLNIRPSKPTDVNVQHIKMNAPPISFGSIQKDNNFDGYIIAHHTQDSNYPSDKPNHHPDLGPMKHEEIYYSNNPNRNIVNFSNSFASTNTTMNHIFDENHGQYIGTHYSEPINSHSQKDANIAVHSQPGINVDVSKPFTHIPVHQSNYKTDTNPPNDYRKPYPRPRPKYPKRPQRLRPKPEIAEYMTPPPPAGSTNLFHDSDRYNTPDVYIAQTVKPMIHVNNRPPIHTSYPTKANTKPLNNYANTINNLYNPNDYNQHTNFNNFVNNKDDLDADGDDEEDRDGEINEAGELIQGSNTRPLRPGEVPIEILRAKNLTRSSSATTTSRPINRIKSSENNMANPQIFNRYNTSIYAKNHTSNINYGSGLGNVVSPVIQKPRPFTVPQVRPENQQNNQIIRYDLDKTGGYRYNSTKAHSNPTTESNKAHVFLNQQNRRPITGESNYQRHPQGTSKIPARLPKTTPPMRATTSRPVISTNMLHKFPPINKTGFSNAILYKVERPKVTSLPIDVHGSTRKPITVLSSLQINNVGSQTEKPFNEIYLKPNRNTPKPLFNFNKEDIITVTKRYFTTTPRGPTTTLAGKLNLNIGELPPKYFSNKTIIPISDMEIMKPPPPSSNNMIREPSVEMKPPKIDIVSPNNIDLYKATNIRVRPFGSDAQSNTPNTYIRKPSEEMIPPPITTEVVIGMNPPAITTHRPAYRPKLPSIKPIYSLQLDPPRTTYRYETSTYPTTVRQPVRTRPTYKRKPVVYYQSTTESTTRPTKIKSPTTGEPISNGFTTKSLPSNEIVHIWHSGKEEGSISLSNNNTTHSSLNTENVSVFKEDIITEMSTSINHSEMNNLEDATGEIKDNVPDSQNIEKNLSEPPIISNTASNSKPDDFVRFHYGPMPPHINSSVKYYRDSSTIKNVVEAEENIKSDATVQINPTRTKTTSKKTVDIITKNSDTMNYHIPGHHLDGVSYKIEPSIISIEKSYQIPTKFLDKTLSSNGKSTNIINTTPTILTINYKSDVKNSENGVKFEVGNTEFNTYNRKPNRTVINKIISINPVSTKYVYSTYTTTSTHTMTEISVITTSGGPPSTFTTVITKTETITIVDTKTETLLLPTNITEILTTTINHFPQTLYSSGIDYGNIRPTVILPSMETVKYNEKDLIITETDPPLPNEVYNDNDSILVVLTDKNSGGIISKDDKETQIIDEVIENNEADKILVGGISIASLPGFETSIFSNKDRCHPECRASKNELCQKVEGVMRCICRPGFARMFPDHPCKPTYTYTLKIKLDRYGKEKLFYVDKLTNHNSSEYNRLMTVTQDALDRMVMQSDLRDIYHGVNINGFERADRKSNSLSNNFNLQLSDNTEERRLTDIFKRYLRSNNYSLGGTELYAAREAIDELAAEDFNECSNPHFHDCSEHAHCFNLRGTYTCSCKEGFADLSENILYPGRICSAEIIGCELCNYHGTCYTRGEDQVICECFQWYAGHSCHINLKVLLIALVTLGTILFTLLLVCIILTCCRRRPSSPGMANGMSFLPQRVTSHGNRRGGTLDRRAMIQDTSSESGQSETNTLPYIPKKPKKLKGALKKPKPKSMTSDTDNENNTLTISDQKDRSLTVMIPRAKYHPAPPTSPHINLTTFEKRKVSAASSNEAKLLSYLDAGPSPDKSIPRKYSNAHSESYIEEKPLSRKTSGALISAGFEVSATVMANNMGTLGTIATTCGTEADRSENATLIQKISADLLSSTSGTRSQFNTLRNVLIDDVIEDPMANWMDTRITTVSEARSYDETTIQPPTKSFRNEYDSKPSSQHHNDGSDISGFESL